MRARARFGVTFGVAFGVALALCASLAFARGASAGPTFTRAELPPLFTEVEAGVSVPSYDAYGPAGLALRAALGVGVPLPDLPMTLYVTASFSWTHLGDTRRTVYRTAELVNDAYVYALGVRWLVRPTARLQAVVDVQGGYRRASSSAVVDGVETHTLTEGDAVPVLGLGARYAVLDWLAVGLRWESVLIPPLDGPDVPANAAGLASPRGERWQMNITLTAAAHF